MNEEILYVCNECNEMHEDETSACEVCGTESIREVQREELLSNDDIYLLEDVCEDEIEEVTLDEVRTKICEFWLDDEETEEEEYEEIRIQAENAKYEELASMLEGLGYALYKKEDA